MTLNKIVPWFYFPCVVFPVIRRQQRQKWEYLKTNSNETFLIVQAHILCPVLPIHDQTSWRIVFLSHQLGWHQRSSVFCKLSLSDEQSRGWGSKYQSTDALVRPKVNYLVNGVSPVLSMENSCLAIDLCHSSLMSADQNPIKNRLVRLASRSWRGGAEIDGGWREQEKSKRETANKEKDSNKEEI